MPYMKFRSSKVQKRTNSLKKEIEDQVLGEWDSDVELLINNRTSNGGILFSTDTINKDQEDQMEVYGYRRHALFTEIISWVFTILTLGAVRLVFHWWPHLMLYSTHYRCPLREAEKLLIVEQPKNSQTYYHVEAVKTVSADTSLKNRQQQKLSAEEEKYDGTLQKIKLPTPVGGGAFNEFSCMRMFEFKKQRYIWDEKNESFFKLEGLDNNISTAGLHEQTGLSLSEELLRQLVYGKNEIVVPMQGITELLFLEVLNPFYIFQIFSFALWFAYDYVCYAVAILIMSASSIIMTVIQTRDSQSKLHSTIHSSDVVSVLRVNGGSKVVSTIPTEQLVPGDLMLIPTHGCVMHCDAVVLTGSCVVNESMLTGESMPVTKTPLPNSQNTLYDSKEHAKHTLFCGTHVIKSRSRGSEHVYAVVIRTGYSTAKGSLVRSILHPTPITFEFEQDSYKFVQLLACLASVGFLYTVITKVMRGVPATTIALEALDLITIVVPPALPAAMTVGCMYAQARLQKNRIYCISPRIINVSGSINCICFDKTGTLTEDGLDMWGVVPSKNGQFKNPVIQLNTLEADHLVFSMATCHSLTIIDDKMCGDPLDLKMFESTGWDLEEPNVRELPKHSEKSSSVLGHMPTILVKKKSQEIEIIQQFPFSSSLQRMSVITRKLEESNFTLYCKGSPEVIRSLCESNSIPVNFASKLEEYTQDGYRVLGIAYKQLPSSVSCQEVMQLPQEAIEADLKFLGLIILENRLKPQTTGVIAALEAAEVRSVMVTGDNELTALSVARECGIIPLRQKVFIVHGSPPQNGESARLYYRLWGKCVTPQNDEKTIDGESSKSSSVITDHHKHEEEIDCGNFGIISTPDVSLALTGATWSIIRTHFPEIVPHVASRGAVFSRMSPDHKQQLVESLQSFGYYVGMCGDGANDCGALKAAHAGISLSEAESSVASPFTSKDPNIECVIKVIREGRAALVTSFGIFKYMAGYSLTQFVSVMILYSIDSNLTDMQYLYIDLFIISTFAFLLGRTEANPGPLVPSPPDTSLMSLTPIMSLIGQVAIVIIFQFISLFSLKKYEWFEPFDSSNSNSEGPGCYENYALFAISSMQYVILAMVFSKGAPYRLPLYKNWSLLATVTAITVFTFYLILSPNQWFREQFELVVPPEMDFRVLTIILCVVNFILAGFHEFYICDYLISHKSRYPRPSKPIREKEE